MSEQQGIGIMDNNSTVEEDQNPLEGRPRPSRISTRSKRRIAKAQDAAVVSADDAEAIVMAVDETWCQVSDTGSSSSIDKNEDHYKSSNSFKQAKILQVSKKMKASIATATTRVTRLQSKNSASSINSDVSDQMRPITSDIEEIELTDTDRRDAANCFKKSSAVSNVGSGSSISDIDIQHLRNAPISSQFMISRESIKQKMPNTSDQQVQCQEDAHVSRPCPRQSRDRDYIPRSSSQTGSKALCERVAVKKSLLRNDPTREITTSTSRSASNRFVHHSDRTEIEPQPHSSNNPPNRSLHSTLNMNRTASTSTFKAQPSHVPVSSVRSSNSNLSKSQCFKSKLQQPRKNPSDRLPGKLRPVQIRCVDKAKASVPSQRYEAQAGKSTSRLCHSEPVPDCAEPPQFELHSQHWTSSSIDMMQLEQELAQSENSSNQAAVFTTASEPMNFESQSRQCNKEDVIRLRLSQYSPPPMPSNKRKNRKLNLETVLRTHPPFVNLFDFAYNYEGVESQILNLRPSVVIQGSRYTVQQSIRVLFDSVNTEQLNVKYYRQRDADIIHFGRFQLSHRMDAHAEYLGHGLYLPQKIKGIKSNLRVHSSQRPLTHSHRTTYLSSGIGGPRSGSGTRPTGQSGSGNTTSHRVAVAGKRNNAKTSRRPIESESENDETNENDVACDDFEQDENDDPDTNGARKAIYLYFQSGCKLPNAGKDFKVYVLVICKLCLRDDPERRPSCLMWLSQGNASKYEKHKLKIHPMEVATESLGRHLRLGDSMQVNSQYAGYVARLYDVMVSTNLAAIWIQHPAVQNLTRHVYGNEIGLPHRSSFMAHINREINRQIPVVMKTLRENIACATIMIDTWESKQRKHVLAINLVYVDFDFDHHQLCLSVSVINTSVAEGVTGKRLADEIVKVVTQYNLHDKITYCISDSGSNAIKAFNFYECWIDSGIENAENAIQNLLTNENNERQFRNPSGDGDDAFDDHDNYSHGHDTLNESDGLLNFPDDNPDDIFVTSQSTIDGASLTENSQSSGTGTIEVELTTLRPAYVRLVDYAPPQPADLPVRLHTQYRCCAHALQLAVSPAIAHAQKAPPTVRNTYLYVNRLTKYIRLKPALCDTLTRMCGKGLKQPNVTRWNSFIDALGRLTEPRLFLAVQFIMQEEHKKSLTTLRNKRPPAIPSAKDFERFQQMFRFLLPLATATDNLQRDGMTSYILIYEIVIAYLHVSQVPGLDADLQNSREIIVEELVRRFAPMFKSSVFIAATVFNPRSKFLFQWIERVMPNDPFKCPKHDDAIAIVRGMMPQHVKEEGLPITIPDVSSINGRKRNNGFVPMGGPTCADARTSFDEYIMEPVGLNPMDLPIYWKLKKMDWPYLAAFVRNFLMPVTTGTIERLFSRLKLINRDQRSTIDAETLNKLVLYNQFCLAKDTMAEIRKKRQKTICRMDLERQSRSSNFSYDHTGEINGSNGAVRFPSYVRLEDYSFDSHFPTSESVTTTTTTTTSGGINFPEPTETEADPHTIFSRAEVNSDIRSQELMPPPPAPSSTHHNKNHGQIENNLNSTKDTLIEDLSGCTRYQSSRYEDIASDQYALHNDSDDVINSNCWTHQTNTYDDIEVPVDSVPPDPDPSNVNYNSDSGSGTNLLRIAKAMSSQLDNILGDE